MIESEVIYAEMTNRFGLEHEELLTLSEIAIIDMDPHTAMNIIAEMTPFQKQNDGRITLSLSFTHRGGYRTFAVR